MSRRLTTTVALWFGCSGLALAEPHRELGPHEHGHGTMNIAIEGTAVSIELEAPGDDIVGFEHDPSTLDETAQLEKAKATLAQPLALFQLPAAAKCVAKDAKITIVEEKHEGGKAAHEGEAPEAHHNAFHIEYRLDCQAAAALTSISFVYFNTFKNAQALTVNIVTAKGQSKFEATRGSPKIDLGMSNGDG